MRAASPDGPPDPGLVDSFLRQALAGPTVSVPADAARREMAVAEVVGRLRAPRARGWSAPRQTRGPARLDYTLDLGARLRLIVLDLVRRGGGSGGSWRPGRRPGWRERSPGPAGAG